MALIQTSGLERELKALKSDNSKLVKTLQETLELNEALRSQLSSLEESVSQNRAEHDQSKYVWSVNSNTYTCPKH